MISNSITL